MLLLLCVLSTLVYTQAIEPNPCDPNPCNSGVCRILENCTDSGGSCLSAPLGDYTCDCLAGFTGLHCDAQDVCSTTTSPCLNGGECIAKISCDPTGPSNPTAICKCTDLNVGPTCALANPCNPNPCQNSGTCIPDDTGAFVCECPPEFTGTTCNNANPCFNSNPCKHGGTCMPDNTVDPPVPVCACTPDYTGKKCDVSLLKCRPNPCHNHATCIETPDQGFECKCLPGFVGKLCQNRCPCMNGGQCVHGHGGQLSCICMDGFTGMNCQFGGGYKRSKVHKKLHKKTKKN